jgi:hypothetical protein
MQLVFTEIKMPNQKLAKKSSEKVKSFEQWCVHMHKVVSDRAKVEGVAMSIVLSSILVANNKAGSATMPKKQKSSKKAVKPPSMPILTKAKGSYQEKVCFELLDRFSGSNLISLPDGVFHTVYVIRHKPTGMFYVGLHSSDSKHSVLKNYFTSSKNVEKLIVADGSTSFFVENQFYFSSREVAYEAEQAVIRHNLPDMNPYLLNMAFTEFGKSDDTDRVIKKVVPVPYHGITLSLHKDNPLSENFNQTDQVAFKSVKFPTIEHHILVK